MWPMIPAKSPGALCVYWRRKSTWAGAFALLRWGPFDRPQRRGHLHRWRLGFRHPHRRGWEQDPLGRTFLPFPWADRSCGASVDASGLSGSDAEPRPLLTVSDIRIVVCGLLRFSVMIVVTNKCQKHDRSIWGIVLSRST